MFSVLYILSWNKVPLLLHGGAKYQATGQGFVVRHVKFAENYRMYSRSHFTKGLELILLLIVYQIFGSATSDATTFMLLTASMWFLVAAWLFAPFLFNPSLFQWQNIVDDWSKWINSRGGIGVPATKSWESWWEEEQEHLLETILSLRFFVVQYGIVYYLHISNNNKILIVYALSWLVIVVVMLVLKVVSMGRKKFSADFQLMFRLLKLLLFLGCIGNLCILFTLLNEKFVCLLPATLSEFMCLLRLLFSNVIDINHLLKEIGSLKKAKSIPSALCYLKRQFFFAGRT